MGIKVVPFKIALDNYQYAYLCIHNYSNTPDALIVVMLKLYMQGFVDLDAYSLYNDTTPFG